jgi:predicted metalloprotease with PDZ domain
MRLMLKRFSAEKGYRREDIREVAAEVVGPADAQEMRDWLARVLETTAELDYAPATEWFGARITPSSAAPRAWLGVTTTTEDQKTVVTGIRRGSPAAVAGLSLLDEIAAINGEPLQPDLLIERLARMPPGTKVTLTIERHDVARAVEVTLGTDPAHGWVLSQSPSATRVQAQRFDAWLAAKN